MNDGGDDIPLKRKLRRDKKKKKMAALINVKQLNDMDRQKTARKQEEKLRKIQELDIAASTTLPQAMEQEGDEFVKVVSKKRKKLQRKQVNPEIPDEPHSKRGKTRASEEDEDHSSELSGTSTLSEESTSEHLLPMNVSLTEQQHAEMRKWLRERKRELEGVVKLNLRELGQRASLQMPHIDRTPLFLTDIQHLLMSALIGKKSPCQPDRWCSIEKSMRLSHSVVLILEGLSLYHYLSYESKFEETNKIFDTRLEVVLPPCEEDMIIQEMAQVPLTNVQAQDLIDQHGSLESAVEMNKDPTLLVKAIFPIEPEPVDCKVSDLPPGDKFPRTKLLLSALQMVDEGYPMPLRGELRERFKDYVYTKSKYAPVTNSSPLFGVDCEMCRTVIGVNELTRISVVNEQMETVYESLVMPSNRIIDYLTPYSGITPEIMKTVTKTLKQVQHEMQALLPPDAILVGQSLNSDLNAMQMMHPYVIDTSICFNLTGQRKYKSKLQTLASTFLKEAIQDKMDGHDSVEDSLASLKLVKMKLANSMEFGDEILSQKRRLHDIVRIANGDLMKNNIFAHASQADKRTAIVTAGVLKKPIKDIVKNAEKAAPQQSRDSISLFELDSNKAAIKKVREVALEHCLTIGNLRLSNDELQLESAEKTVSKIDKWISKLWKIMAHNGMLIVLMGGSTDSPSGVVKIAIKNIFDSKLPVIN